MQIISLFQYVNVRFAEGECPQGTKYKIEIIN